MTGMTPERLAEAIDRLTTFLESHKHATQDQLHKGQIRRIPSPDELVRHGDQYGNVTAEVRASDIAAVLAELATARTRIDGARGIHAPDDYGNCKVCVRSWGMEETQPSPCPTDRALTGQDSTS